MLFLKMGNYIKEHTPDAENAGSLSFGLFPSEMKPILPRCLNSRFSVFSDGRCGHIGMESLSANRKRIPAPRLPAGNAGSGEGIKRALPLRPR